MASSSFCCWSGDHHAVGGDLLVHVVDLAVQQEYFLVQPHFLVDQGVDVVQIGVLLLLQFGKLSVEFIALALQFVDLALNLAGTGGIHFGGQCAGAKDQRSAQKRSHQAAIGFGKFHGNDLDSYTSMNLRMEVQLPTMPTKAPAAQKVMIMGTSRVVKGTNWNSCKASTSWTLVRSIL